MAVSKILKQQLRYIAMKNDRAYAEILAKLEQYDALVVNFNALLAKLDADSGITDVDYVTELEVE